MAEQKPQNLEEDEPISLESDSAEEEEAISLVDTEEAEAGTLRAFGAAAGKKRKEVALKRPLNITGQGATRCRMFHSKIAAASLEFMEDQINQWLDSDKIEAKHVGHVIGVLEGKTAEPNLFVVVWY